MDTELVALTSKLDQRLASCIDNIVRRDGNGKMDELTDSIIALIDALAKVGGQINIEIIEMLSLGLAISTMKSINPDFTI